MGKVRTGHATSLDGFIAGPNDGPDAPMGEGGERLLAWYFGGDSEYRLPNSEMVFKVASQTAEFLRETRETTGALVTGRRTFDLTRGWGGRHPLDVPVFVVTRKPAPEWVSEGSPFTFVGDGLETALEQAKAAAGDKDVGVIGANLVQQCLEAGLLDEVHLDLVPVVRRRQQAIAASSSPRSRACEPEHPAPAWGYRPRPGTRRGPLPPAHVMPPPTRIRCPAGLDAPRQRFTTVCC